ncbi:hypothetical protein [Lutibacter sp.]
MNKPFNTLAIILLPLLFSFCGNSKIKNLQSPPFKVVNAVYSYWVGGQPGVKGIKIKIAIDNPSIKLDSVYFRGNALELQKDMTSQLPTFIGTYIFPYKPPVDLIMSDNSVQEYGNKPHPISSKKQRNLKKNEALISYKYNQKRVYFKINELTEEIESTFKN